MHSQIPRGASSPDKRDLGSPQSCLQKQNPLWDRGGPTVSVIFLFHRPLLPQALASSVLQAQPFPRVVARELNEKRSERKCEQAEGAFKGEIWEETREDIGSLGT